MASSDSDKPPDEFRYDLVAYLAQRLGVSQEVALARLGDWLVDAEAAQTRIKRPLPHFRRGP